MALRHRPNTRVAAASMRVAAAAATAAAVEAPTHRERRAAFMARRQRATVRP